MNPRYKLKLAVEGDVDTIIHAVVSELVVGMKLDMHDVGNALAKSEARLLAYLMWINNVSPEKQERYLTHLHTHLVEAITGLRSEIEQRALKEKVP